jgi:hypothetical protein
MKLMALLRKMLGVRCSVDRSRAIALAQEYCKHAGYEWVEPVHVEERLRHYWIWTNSDRRGGNVSVQIRCEDGTVAQAVLVPR